MDNQQSKQKDKEKEPYDFKADLQISITSIDEYDFIEQSLRRLQKNAKILSKHSAVIEQDIVKLLKDTYENKLLDSFIRILKIFEIFKKLQANFIFYDFYFTAFQTFAGKDIKSLSKDAIANWANIPAICLDNYLNVFGIAKEIDPKEVESQINYLMLMKKVPEAIKIFNIFNMREHMNMFDLLDRTLSQDKVADAIMLVEKNEVKLQMHLINILTQKSYIDKCVELISNYNLDYKDFPNLIQKMEKKHVERVLPTPDLWEKAEERVHTNKEVLCYLVEALVEQGKSDEAMSIVKRHHLQETEYYKTNIKRIQNTGQYIPNNILEKDGFGPSEEVIFGAEEGTYIHLKQYNISEDDVIFINDIEYQKEQFENAKKEIFGSKVVGFDSEFASQWNKFEKGGVSIIQFATKKKIFIFDALTLLGPKVSNDFVKFCKDLFESQEIIKVGHSISTDLNEMDKTFKSDKKFDLNNFVDVALLNRDIFSLPNTASLKFMTQKLLNLQMSKFEQVSNWDKRPLRKSQLHYAAIDAFIVIQLYEKLVEIQKAGGVLNYVNVYQEESKDTSVGEKIIKQNLTLIVDNRLSYTKDNEHFFKMKKTTKIKFLVDNMLFKLVKYLRNSGLDAAYVTERDYQLVQDLSLREERIIITRDNKLFNMKKNVPVYILQENLDTEAQFKEILDFFKIDQNKLVLLSRCVKCNNSNIVTISGKEAMNHLKFTNPQDFNKYEYWQCTQCKQVYWEGDTFKKSQKRFEDLTNKKKKK